MKNYKAAVGVTDTEVSYKSPWSRCQVRRVVTPDINNTFQRPKTATRSTNTYVKTESRHKAARVHRREVKETELGEKLTVIKYPETSGGPLQVSARGKSDRPECSAVQCSPDYSSVRCTSAQDRPVYPRWLPSTTGPLRR